MEAVQKISNSSTQLSNGNTTTALISMEPQKMSVVKENMAIEEKILESDAKSRAFNFSRYPRRRIALMFLYYGWEFDGLVIQSNTNNTVEEVIFNTLIKTKLIESRDSCRWTRCGRTDKGVSAFHQVAALNVRSTDTSAEGIWWAEEGDLETRITSDKEMEFLKILNGNLPRSIKAIAWSPLKNVEFSPRHDCIERTYKYFMPAPNLNIEAITEAANLLKGSHDFRNFCKIDDNEARLKMSYIRSIYDVQLNHLKSTSQAHSSTDSQFDLLEITIRGSGFLWHQIRCIVSLLYEIGRGNDKPEVISELFDIEKYPGRPAYDMAAETPLCLFDCNFKEDFDLDWKYDVDALIQTIGHLQMSWTEFQTKAAIIRSMIEGLSPIIAEKSPENFPFYGGFHKFMLGQGTTKIHAKSRPYVPILKRKACESLETRRRKKGLKIDKLDSPTVNENMDEE